MKKIIKRKSDAQIFINKLSKVIFKEEGFYGDYYLTHTLVKRKGEYFCKTITSNGFEDRDPWTQIMNPLEFVWANRKWINKTIKDGDKDDEK